MYKLYRKSLIVIIILLFNSTAIFGSTLETTIDQSQLVNGLISVRYDSQRGTQTKVMISKDNTKYTYDAGINNNFPLQFGDGTYTVSVLENVKDNKYKVIEQKKVVYIADQPNRVFLQSIQMINWSSEIEAAKKAKELTQKAKNDHEKIAAIYQYIVQNVKYDTDKASQVKSGYIPSVDNTLKSLKGICYDYSALFAAMLRSLDIPAKLVMGHKSDISTYHAWNQIYLKDTKEWITIDTTYDAAFVKSELAYKMVKDSNGYTVEKEY